MFFLIWFASILASSAQVLPDLTNLADTEVRLFQVCNLITCSNFINGLLQPLFTGASTFQSSVTFNQAFTAIPKTIIIPSGYQSGLQSQVYFNVSLGQQTLTGFQLTVNYKTIGQWTDLWVQYFSTINPLIAIQQMTIKSYTSSKQTLKMYLASPYLQTPGVIGHLDGFAFSKNYSLSVKDVKPSQIEFYVDKNDFSGSLSLQSIIVNQTLFISSQNQVSRAYVETRIFNGVPPLANYSVNTTDLLYTLPNTVTNHLVGLTVFYQTLAFSQSYYLYPSSLPNGQKLINVQDLGFASTLNFTWDISTITFQTCDTTNGFYFGDLYCEGCHYSCSNCSDGLNTSCSSCKSTAFRYLVNQTCTCFDGYFDDGQNQTCQQCHYSCQTCNGTHSTDCLTCNQTHNRTLTVMSEGNACTCTEQFYESNVAQCSKYICSYQCQTCFGVSFNQCLTCGDNRVQANNSCVCPDGFYDDGVKSPCQACDQSCKTCSGQGPYKCISCNQPLELNNQSQCLPVVVIPSVSNETLPSQNVTAEPNITVNSTIEPNITVNTTPNTTEPPLPNTTIEPKPIVCEGGVLIKKKCVPCHPMCITCTGPLQSQCLTCRLDSSYDVTVDTLGITRFDCKASIFVQGQLNLYTCVEGRIFVAQDFKKGYYSSQWSVVDDKGSIVFKSSTNSMDRAAIQLSLPTKTLQPSSDYQIKIKIFDQNNILLVQNSTNISTIEGGLTVNIIGGDMRWGTDNLNILEVQVQDMNQIQTIITDYENYDFLWECYDYYRKSCTDKLGNVLQLNRSQSQQSFSPKTLQPYKGLNFTCIVIDLIKNISYPTSSQIQVFEGTIPSLSLNYDPMLKLSKTNIQEEHAITFIYNSTRDPDSLFYSANLYYDYSIVSTIVFQYAMISFTIWDYFDQFTNKSGPKLYFVASVYDPRYQTPSQSTIQFTVNIPPQGCVLSISPDTGSELTTQFMASVTSCDDVNLTYKFGYYLSYDDYQQDLLYSQFNYINLLTDFQQSSKAYFNMPRTDKGSIYFLASVQTTVGAIRNLTQVIEVRSQNLYTEIVKSQIIEQCNMNDTNTKILSVNSLLQTLQLAPEYWSTYQPVLDSNIAILKGSYLSDFQIDRLLNIISLYYQVQNQAAPNQGKIEDQLKFAYDKMNKLLDTKSNTIQQKSIQGNSLQIQNQLTQIEQQLQQVFSLIGSILNKGQMNVVNTGVQNAQIETYSQSFTEQITYNSYLDMSNSVPNQKMVYFESEYIKSKQQFLSLKYLKQFFQQESTFTRLLISESALTQTSDCCYSYQLIDFKKNPYANSRKFPYPKQNYSVQTLNLKKSSNSVNDPNTLAHSPTLNASQSLQYKITQSLSKNLSSQNSSNDVCIQYNPEDESWKDEGCTLIQTSTQEQMLCQCKNVSATTVVNDQNNKYQQSIFTQKSLDAIANFRWYEAALTYIMISITMLYLSLVFWGQRQDYFDQNEHPDLKTSILGSPPRLPQIIEPEQDSIRIPEQESVHLPPHSNPGADTTVRTNRSPDDADSGGSSNAVAENIGSVITINRRQRHFKYALQHHHLNNSSLNTSGMVLFEKKKLRASKSQVQPLEPASDAVLQYDYEDNERYTVDFLKPVPHIPPQNNVEQNPPPPPNPNLQSLTMSQKMNLPFHKYLLIYHPILGIYSLYNKIISRPMRATLVYLTILQTLAIIVYFGNELQIVRTLFLMTISSLLTNFTLFVMRSMLSSPQVAISFAGVTIFLCMVCLFSYVIMAVISMTKTVQQTNVWAAQYLLSFFSDYLIFAPLRTYLKYKLAYIVLRNETGKFASLLKKILFNATDLEIIKSLLS